MNFIEEKLSEIDSVPTAVSILLKALENANNNICKGVDPFEAGSTTLTGD
jgi:hypothetical protein